MLFDAGAELGALPTGAGVFIGGAAVFVTMFGLAGPLALPALFELSPPQPAHKATTASKTEAPVNLRMGLSSEILDDSLKRR